MSSSRAAEAGGARRGRQADLGPQRDRRDAATRPIWTTSTALYRYGQAEVKGNIDILYASAGTGEARSRSARSPSSIDETFDLNARGTLFTVQKALPLINDGGSIILTGSCASAQRAPPVTACMRRARRRCTQPRTRTWLNDLKGTGISG
jgi:NAD(P)-dependent dehydrogenase (short-subunit alcohol dehydrogenase family)